MHIDHLSVRTAQMQSKERQRMTAGENVLQNTMKLDKTVNQQRRPFIPKESRGERLIVPMRKSRMEENTNWQKET